MPQLLITIFLLLTSAELSMAQKFLQLEKMHSPRTRRYLPGDEITFQLKGGQWYTRVIEDVSYDQNLILFAQGHVNVDDITAFRTFNNRKWSRPIGNQLVNFAVVWTGFSLISAAVDKEDDYSPGDAILAGSSAALGFTLKRLFRQRTFSLQKNKKGENKRWRLRVLDLNVK